MRINDPAILAKVEAAVDAHAHARALAGNDVAVASIAFHCARELAASMSQQR
ncbi:hypothetical protein [Cupriavidus basilensis]|uniref:Uncharacterized protein n=1 Tax=Cupriavidus basilensis TaxID=68895 RepID=A0A0C4YBL1_9BURK|nr:hypothetical protein [Cupriavidus basilensis]AJG22972.1 hypothetical protein RR42_s1384 [Cupriavidus basilensis]